MFNQFEIRFDGATLVGEAGGFGMPVVFLHAGVADRRLWANQMEALAAEGYHVIAYDRRGHGETTSPDEPFNHLVDLEAVLDQLGIHAAVFVGSSMGGAREAEDLCRQVHRFADSVLRWLAARTPSATVVIRCGPGPRSGG
jgi:pimeloyl-ACP methyl ester carboxylesterase